MLFVTLLMVLLPRMENSKKGIITIQFSGIEKQEGYIQLNVFNNHKGFPNDEKSVFKTYRVKVSSGENSFIITDLPYGEYAISCFQDKNGNKKLDTNFMGIPKEKVGTSNNPRSGGIPNYNDAKFNFNKLELHLSITLK